MHDLTKTTTQIQNKHTHYSLLLLYTLHYWRISTCEWNVKASNGDAGSFAMHAAPLLEEMRPCACVRVQVCVLVL